MIGSIKGKIILKTEKFLIVETNGVGYKISVSPDTLFQLSAPHSYSGQNNTEVDYFGFTHMCVKIF